MSKLFGSFWLHRQLIARLTLREILNKYKGSVFGLLWSFFNPVFMLIVYTFFFGLVFKVRWGEGENTKEFALILFAGLIVYNFFAECMTKAPALILSNANYVKKVVFPLEVLAVVCVSSALFHFFISFFVWCVFGAIVLHRLEWTLLFVPLLIAPFALILLGLTWFVCSLGVYLRDVGQLIGVLVMAMSFMSPIFYPVSMLPEGVQHLIYINPLTFIIEEVRKAMFYGDIPNLSMLMLYGFISLAIAFLGLLWFQKTRKGFADVL
ncbi:ABC transporter permease [Chitiniphilus purpureus]|uniref:Transport permease protein n=1 Tax=Chitiniphilus purpureus TaxID=2981137 RepID=A0ABY6DMG1_9NEIS|nr:ABC transporter permease [Chitiniphilus sp. CD1]UXY15537.1 ABC transporter permease [Chitiniphilus sp. CD1]